jgi:hypothetical protein
VIGSTIGDRVLHGVLRRVSRRMRVARALVWGARAVLCTGAPCVIVLLFVRTGVLQAPAHAWAWTWAGGGLVVAAGLGLGAWRAAPAERAARAVDDSHRLADRVASALDFLARPERTAFMDAAIRDASAAAAGVDARRAAPLRLPRELRAIGMLAVLAALAALLPLGAGAVAPGPVHTLRVKLAPADLAVLRSEAVALAGDDDPEAAAIALELRRLLDDLARGECARADALSRLAGLEWRALHAQPGDTAEIREALRGAGNELLRARPTAAVGLALAGDHFERARAELRSLAEQLAHTSASRRSGAARALAAAERRLRRDAPPASGDAATSQGGRALERLRRDLDQAASDAPANPAGAAKALEQAADSLDRMAKELSRMAQVQRITARILEMRRVVAGKGKQEARQRRLRDFMARSGGRPDMLLLGEGDTQIRALGQETSSRPAGGEAPGDAHEPLRLDAAMPKSPRHRDVGVEGRDSPGPTRAEVIYSASERGFSAVDYRRVFADYSGVVEEALTQENVPPGRRGLVRRYFDLIRPPR